jgi:hypothetical protein
MPIFGVPVSADGEGGGSDDGLDAAKKAGQFHPADPLGAKHVLLLFGNVIRTFKATTEGALVSDVLLKMARREPRVARRSARVRVELMPKAKATD